MRGKKKGQEDYDRWKIRNKQISQNMHVTIEDEIGDMETFELVTSAIFFVLAMLVLLAMMY